MLLGKLTVEEVKTKYKGHRQMPKLLNLLFSMEAMIILYTSIVGLTRKMRRTFMITL